MRKDMIASAKAAIAAVVMGLVGLFFQSIPCGCFAIVLGMLSVTFAIYGIYDKIAVKPKLVRIPVSRRYRRR